MNKTDYYKGVFTIENFLSEEECDKLIEFSENKGYKAAKVNIDGAQKLFTMVRNNERILHKDIEMANSYWDKLKSYCSNKIGNSLPIGLNELFRFYKYTKDQRFKKHKDGSYIRNEFEFSLMTFMIYLNDDFEGGKTTFNEFEINPKKGTALIFLHDLKHEGQSITSGTKYVLRSDIMYRINQ